MVEATRPPITARPSGADCSPPSPSASAVGIIPAIIARLVIRIGRSAPARPTRPIASTLRDRRRATVAREGHEEHRVRDRDADRHHRAHHRLHVERRAREPAASHDAGEHRGRVAISTTMSGSRIDWKFAASIKSTTITASAEPFAKALQRRSHLLGLAVDARRSFRAAACRAPAIACSTSGRGAAEVGRPATLAVTLDRALAVVVIDLAGRRPVA